MNDFIARLSSRKFLLVIGGSIMLLSGQVEPETAERIIKLIMAFLGLEGTADIVQRFTKEKSKQASYDFAGKATIATGTVPPGFGGDQQPSRTIQPGE